MNREPHVQVWQNILQLWEYDTAERVVRGRARRVLVPARRRIVDRNAAAAVFVRFGFDKAGHLPYEVFIQGINESPARLLGHGLLLNKTLSGRNGVENLVDVALLVDDAKVDYPKSAMGVFPPSGFDERLALRSMKLPRAHMWLEHVYGYAGFNNLANNLFFTHNTAGAFNEVVFYAGMLGVVATWIDGDDAFGMRQRFFFGHDNDVLCLAAHPNRRFVATGQQTSTAGRPYACVWDIGEYGSDDAARLASGNPARMRGVGAAREPVQLQRLEVDKAFRSILAVAFSGDPHAGAGGGDRGPDRRGGELLVTLCGDNHHTVHVWRWMVPAELPSAAGKKVLFSHCKAMYIPSWHFGPEKKLPDLAAAYPYYSSPDDSGPQRYVPGTRLSCQPTALRTRRAVPRAQTVHVLPRLSGEHKLPVACRGAERARAAPGPRQRQEERRGHRGRRARVRDRAPRPGGACGHARGPPARAQSAAQVREVQAEPRLCAHGAHGRA